ncbi:MAG TPA: Xaa-Pro aminopeptidase [Thiobacillaceae bacterium]|nr:Xaa-Pro aminopeptidase [Thiobacillaceae bacterium]
MKIQTFTNRRARLAEQLREGVAIVANGPEVTRNRDSHYAYRFDSYFHYLTAFPEPEAVCVVIAGKSPRSILFCRDKDAEREIWDGYRFGAEAAQRAFGFDEAYSITELDERLPELLANQPRLAYVLGVDSNWDGRVLGWLNAVRAKSRAGVSAPEEIIDARRWLDEMRVIKDETELDVMRRAAAISSTAHRRAMTKTRPGKFEYEIEAELLHDFVRHGARHPAYTAIVAGGANACVLHYVENSSQLKDGDLLLIDAGCELEGYASDITRTFPVKGKFSGPQQAAYEIVLQAQLVAIDTVRPGTRWNEPHEAALRILTQGMVDLKLLQGEVDGLIEQEAYKRFYMHRTGHWLGRDVHDAGEYKLRGAWRQLEAGMVLTVEPGLYIRPAEDVPAAFHNIGIRIEDDVAVTETGHEVLSSAPKAVAEIEACMAGQ